MSESNSRLTEACRRFADVLRKSVDVVDDSDEGRRHQRSSRGSHASAVASHSLIELTGETGALIRAAGDEAARLNVAFEGITRRLKFNGYRMPRVDKRILDAFEEGIRELDEPVQLIVGRGRRRAPAASDDALDQTVNMLKGSRSKIKLVRFLASKPDRRAALDEIVVAVRGQPKPNGQRRRSARRLAEHLRDALDEKSCPLRAEILDCEVRLF